jgi:hypothetical protein
MGTYVITIDGETIQMSAQSIREGGLEVTTATTTYQFRVHAGSASPTGDYTITGVGRDERHALLNALQAPIRVSHYVEGAGYAPSLSGTDILHVKESDTILGGKGGWEVVYTLRHDGNVEHPVLWVHRGVAR